MTISPDTLVHIFLVAFISILAYIFNHIVIKPHEETRELIIKHIDECNKVPKVLILERIDNLTKMVEGLKK